MTHWRVGLRQLRRKAGRVNNLKEGQKFLKTMCRNLEALGFGDSQCGLYLKEEIGAKQMWLAHTLKDGSQWRRVVAAEEVHAVDVLYDKTIEHDYGEPLIIRGSALGYWRTRGQVLLAMPLINGVVGFSSADPEAFDDIEVDCIEATADFLDDFVQRLGSWRDLETKELQLRQAQRLAMVGQLAAGIVHEANNALTVIMGHSELLLVSQLEELARESAESISKAVRNTQQIVAKMLDLARFQDGDHGKLDLNYLVMETLQLVRRQFDRDRIELEVQLDPQLPICEASGGQIQQVVLNLVQNSRDAILDSQRRGVVLVKSYKRDRCVVLAVEDNGPGIPAAIAARIFEPFFTTKEKGRGTGLGLSVCQRIAEEHGGQLRLEKRGLGTCISLEIPISPGLS